MEESVVLFVSVIGPTEFIRLRKEIRFQIEVAPGGFHNAGVFGFLMPCWEEPLRVLQSIGLVCGNSFPTPRENIQGRWNHTLNNRQPESRENSVSNGVTCGTQHTNLINDEESRDEPAHRFYHAAQVSMFNDFYNVNCFL